MTPIILLTLTSPRGHNNLELERELRAINKLFNFTFTAIMKFFCVYSYHVHLLAVAVGTVVGGRTNSHQLLDMKLICR